jgi:alkylation response protein AidB-like acyl-CoA dehydrogenase
VSSTSASSHPLISAEDATRADREGGLPERVVAELTAAGFPRRLVPLRWGGEESSFEELFYAITCAGESCASAAWCAALWALHGRYAARLPELGRREIWRNTEWNGGSDGVDSGEAAESNDLADVAENPARSAHCADRAGAAVRISAAVVPPAGQARRAEGGWRLNGRWEYVSGIEHAHWVLLSAQELPDVGADAASGDGSTAAGAGTVRVVAVPAAELEIEYGWDAIGLRGTGSHRVLARDVFVPERRTMTFAEMTRAEPGPDVPRCQAAPAFLFGGALMAAAALGAARSAVADWTRRALAAGETHARLSADPAAAQALTRSSGQLEAAHLLLTGVVRRADTGPMDDAAVATNMRDVTVAVGLLVESVEGLMRVGGTAAREANGGFHRGWRDVCTAASHGALRLSTAATLYARSVEAEAGGPR